MKVIKKLISLASLLIVGTMAPVSALFNNTAKNSVLGDSTLLEKEKNVNSERIPVGDILTTDPIEIIKGTAQNFFNQLKKNVFDFLEKNGIITCLRDKVRWQCLKYYVLNSNSNHNYFIVPISMDNKSFSLVFRSRDMYIIGFVIGNIYYYFNNSEITNLPQLTNTNLRFDSNYNTLVPDGENPEISWSTIVTALASIMNHNPGSPFSREDKENLARIILATAESMRFVRVSRLITNQDQPHFWNELIDVIRNWGRTTDNAVDYIRAHRNLDGWDNPNQILIFTQAMNTVLNPCDNLRERLNLRIDSDLCYLFESEIEINDATIIKDEKNWGYENFVLKVVAKLAKLIRQVGSLETLKEDLLIITANIGGIIVGIGADNNSISKIVWPLGMEAIGLSIAKLMTTLYSYPNAFLNLFKNNNIDSGLRIAYDAESGELYIAK